MNQVEICVFLPTVIGGAQNFKKPSVKNPRLGGDASKLRNVHGLATRLAPSRRSWPSCAAWSKLGTGTPPRPTAAGSSAGPPSRPSAVGGTPRTSAHARGWLIRQSKK